MMRNISGRDDMRRGLLQSDSFHVELGGISAGGFLRCSGLGGGVDVFDYLEGGSEVPRRFVGTRHFDTIVLERGLTKSRQLYDWFCRGDRRDGAIVLLSRGGEERMRWGFSRAWPRRWEGPDLDADRSEVAVERLEIVHEGIECLL